MNAGLINKNLFSFRSFQYRNLFSIIISIYCFSAPLYSRQNAEACDYLQVNSLPIKLIGFNGSPQKDIILLKWITAAEVNVNHYELEKSTDGTDFRFINKQTAKGIAKTTEIYGAEDFKPATGINYYRLKIVGNDGKISYSKTITVSYK